MRAEYLLFDLAVFSAPFVLSWIKGPTFFAHRFTKAMAAIAFAAVPFLVWDILVAGRHWWFSETYTLGPTVLGLPLEEWGFFLVVPFACLYTWEILLKADRGRAVPLGWIGQVAPLLLIPLAAWVWMTSTREYTSLSLACVGLAAAVDLAGARILSRPRSWVALAVVSGLTVVFNNFLTGRPIVLYDAQYQLDLRLWTMPIEDLGFGLGLMILTFTSYEWLKAREAEDPSFGLLARLLRRRLRGYRVRITEPELDRPERLEGREVRVAVVGGGLAGLTTAVTLSDRGFAVTLFEKNDYLGGKVGGWTFESGGETLRTDHGFHAFFRQYYNLNRFLEETGLVEGLRPIDDYQIWTQDGRAVGFAGTSTVPGINLLSLARVGLYKLLPVAKGPAGPRLEAMLRYDRDETFAEFDDVSFDEFADEAQLPDDLRLVFTTFARAFFADGRVMSMAELIKSFHFYYLSNDKGLRYDFLDRDYALSVDEPLRARLLSKGAELRMSTPVEAMTRDGEGIAVNGDRFDYAVVTADVPGARAALTGDRALLEEDPRLAEQIDRLKSGQRYAVLRVWLSGVIDRDGAPQFVISERDRVLDSIAFSHRVTQEARAWADANDGSVIELHCYALPDALSDDGVRDALLEEAAGFLPGLTDVEVVHEHLQIKRDFPAFHVGMSAHRPETASSVDRLFLAGDWVKLPWPAMLMEAACASGLHASNHILEREQVRRVAIDAVPPEGLLAGLPQTPRPPSFTKRTG